MALSNSQYDALIHEYEIKQFENRQRALDRQRELYEHIPELHDLDEQAASLSVQSVIANLESDSKDTDTLHTQLEESRPSVCDLFVRQGIRLIIWRKYMTVLTAKTQASLIMKNVIASNRKLSIWYILNLI